jgi:S-adenosylmethionine:tRNA ribosyltransferase-isomerase
MPRSSAKMLVIDRASGRITHSTVAKIADFLPQETQIIVNNTKVIKARIFGQKLSGAKIECVIVKPLPNGTFLTLLRGKIRVGDRVLFDENISLEVLALLDDGSREVRFFDSEKPLEFLPLIEKLENIGHIPLPPYIHRADEKSDEANYQSRFALTPGSVAAPTASLHFDEELLKELRAKYPFFELTLHVGLGTFKPVEAENIDEHKIHSEYFVVPPKTAEVLSTSAKVLCIGTTSARTVEFYHRTKQEHGECDIFIHPENKPQRVDLLLTNFHLPKSTLIMLVSSFLGLEKTLEVYEEAKKEKYRFYSYGDAMLIL